jgi:MYXO-CTERM domain-containing protein
VVSVSDSLGNTATAQVSVTAGGAVTEVPFSRRPPVSGWSCGCSSSEGSGPGVVVLALLWLGRGAHRRRRAALVTLLVVAPVMVATAAPKAPAAKKTKKPAPAPTPPPAPTVVVPPAPVEPPPPATPPPPAKPTNSRPNLVVLDVDVSVPNEKLDAAAFSEMLVASIDGADKFRVIGSKELVTLIGLERQRQLLGCSEDTSCMAEIASALGSEFICSASVGKVGTTYLVTMRLIVGSTSRTVARSTMEVNDPNLLLKAIWKTSQDLLDRYGATLPPAEAAVWAARPKQTPPAKVADDAVPNFFGVQAGVVGGYQALSEAGKRTSIGAEVDLTFQRGRFDVSAGLIIGPNLGVRLAASFALLASRFRLGLGLRGAAYPGLALVGGGPHVLAEFTLLSIWSLFANGGVEFSPSKSGLVLVGLATLGTGVRF